MTNLSPHVAACEQLLKVLEPKSEIVVETIDTLERLEELWRIDSEAYGNCSLTLEEFSAWWRRYEFGSRNLISQGRIAASIGIYPLYPEQALLFSTGQMEESDLTPVTLTECEQCPVSDWYFSGIVVRNDLRGWGSPLPMLLKLGIGYWLASGHVAYPLSAWAIAEYSAGARLLNFLGFSKFKDGSLLPDGYDLYRLHLACEREALTVFRTRGL